MPLALSLRVQDALAAFGKEAAEQERLLETFANTATHLTAAAAAIASASDQANSSTMVGSVREACVERCGQNAPVPVRGI